MRSTPGAKLWIEATPADDKHASFFYLLQNNQNFPSSMTPLANTLERFYRWKNFSA
jgi:hypothetical protein